MVHNPIYDQGPMYDTIPIASEKQIEINGISSSSESQTSASTFTAARAANAYVDDPCLTHSPDNVNGTQRVHINLGSDAVDSVTAIPCLKDRSSGHVTVSAEEEEESYMTMFPDGKAN